MLFYPKSKIFYIILSFSKNNGCEMKIFWLFFLSTLVTNGKQLVIGLDGRNSYHSDLKE
jgi:hypothetical protein